MFTISAPLHLSCVVKSLSRVRPSATPCTAALQAPSSMGFSRQECRSGVPSPSPFCVDPRLYLVPVPFCAHGRLPCFLQRHLLESSSFSVSGWALVCLFNKIFFSRHRIQSLGKFYIKLTVLLCLRGPRVRIGVCWHISLCTAQCLSSRLTLVLSRSQCVSVWPSSCFLRLSWICGFMFSSSLVLQIFFLSSLHVFFPFRDSNGTHAGSHACCSKAQLLCSRFPRCV